MLSKQLRSTFAVSTFLEVLLPFGGHASIHTWWLLGEFYLSFRNGIGETMKNHPMTYDWLEPSNMYICFEGLQEMSHTVSNSLTVNVLIISIATRPGHHPTASNGRKHHVKPSCNFQERHLCLCLFRHAVSWSSLVSQFIGRKFTVVQSLVLLYLNTPNCLKYLFMRLWDEFLLMSKNQDN